MAKEQRMGMVEERSRVSDRKPKMKKKENFSDFFVSSSADNDDDDDNVCDKSKVSEPKKKKRAAAAKKEPVPEPPVAVAAAAAAKRRTYADVAATPTPTPTPTPTTPTPTIAAAAVASDAPPAKRPARGRGKRFTHKRKAATAVAVAVESRDADADADVESSKQPWIMPRRSERARAAAKRAVAVADEQRPVKKRSAGAQRAQHEAKMPSTPPPPPPPPPPQANKPKAKKPLATRIRPLPQVNENVFVELVPAPAVQMAATKCKIEVPVFVVDLRRYFELQAADIAQRLEFALRTVASLGTASADDRIFDEVGQWFDSRDGVLRLLSGACNADIADNRKLKRDDALDNVLKLMGVQDAEMPTKAAAHKALCALLRRAEIADHELPARPADAADGAPAEADNVDVDDTPHDADDEAAAADVDDADVPDDADNDAAAADTTADTHQQLEVRVLSFFLSFFLGHTCWAHILCNNLLVQADRPVVVIDGDGPIPADLHLPARGLMRNQQLRQSSSTLLRYMAMAIARSGRAVIAEWLANHIGCAPRDVPVDVMQLLIRRLRNGDADERATFAARLSAADDVAGQLLECVRRGGPNCLLDENGLVDLRFEPSWLHKPTIQCVHDARVHLATAATSLLPVLKRASKLGKRVLESLCEVLCEQPIELALLLHGLALSDDVGFVGSLPAQVLTHERRRAFTSRRYRSYFQDCGDS
jgi:hypothetical protein